MQAVHTNCQAQSMQYNLHKSVEGFLRRIVIFKWKAKKKKLLYEFYTFFFKNNCKETSTIYFKIS